MSLREYARKRKFGETPEPASGGRASRKGHQPIFVVQLHHATARHYDFRLEADGALKSWAVPKGPSLRPGEQRLAVEVEDHPISYAKFGGDIPEGHYGAGHVDVFDHGTWQPEEDDPLKAIAAGKLDFELHGKHLRGRWTLVRTRRQGSKNQWLLLKRSDDEARDAEADDFLDAKMRKATVAWRRAHGQKADAQGKLIGRSAAATKKAAASKTAPRSAAGEKAVAKKTATRKAARRNKSGGSTKKSEAAFKTKALALDGARARPLPAGFHAQLAMQKSTPPTGEAWLHETKWDGYRLLTDLDHGKAKLRSRNDLDWTARVPHIVEALQALPVRQARLDGELVALDARGDSDFAGLQQALKDGNGQRLRYVLFDMPGVAGVDLTRTPLLERKQLLEDLLADADEVLAFSTHVQGHGAEVFAAAGHRGLEGIVSKRVDSGYDSKRTPDWIKVKHANSDEFVIVGYTPPQGSRQGFGSLLLATQDKGELRYVGRIGTGFDDAMLRELTKKMKALAVADAVVEIPAHVPLPARRIHWIRPKLVIEVAFRGWGGHRLLRQGSFMRLREDKNVDDLDMRSSKPASRKRVAAKKSTAKATSKTAVKNTSPKPAAANAGEVTITHASRVVYPDSKITKGDVADYYTAISKWILPELVERPLSMLRCPGGVGGECFFQKHHAATLGGSVKAIPLKEKDAGVDDYVYIRDLHGLLELVQMNTLEFHPWGARVDKPDAPDRIVFDLDPAEGVAWKAVVAAAREIRARLDEIGLQSFVRTSGGKGLHVVLPFRRGPSWATVKQFCESFADAMVALHPLQYIATASKAQRKDKIFIDWLRNARGATSVCSWSLRARAGAPVAMPLRWEELGRIRNGAAFDLKKALTRAKGLKADPWQDIAKLKQSLPKL